MQEMGSTDGHPNIGDTPVEACTPVQYANSTNGIKHSSGFLYKRGVTVGGCG